MARLPYPQPRMHPAVFVLMVFWVALLVLSVVSLFLSVSGSSDNYINKDRLVKIHGEIKSVTTDDLHIDKDCWPDGHKVTIVLRDGRTYELLSHDDHFRHPRTRMWPGYFYRIEYDSETKFIDSCEEIPTVPEVEVEL